MRARRAFFIVFLVGTLPTTSCGNSDTASLRRAQRLWRANHVTAYRYTVQTSCFCAFTGPVNAEVRNGAVVSWSRTDGQPVTNQTFTLTVDSLFANIERAMGRSESSVTAEFDPSLGYPKHVSIDWIKHAVDDEVAYEVLSLTVLER